MNERDDDALQAALKRAMPPTYENDLSEDLWRADAEAPGRRTDSFAWLDWGLAAAAILWLLLFPEILLPLLYHL